MMTDDELDELFGVAELSEPYTYADTSTCTTSTTPRSRVLLLLPTVQYLTDELLA